MCCIASGTDDGLKVCVTGQGKVSARMYIASSAGSLIMQLPAIIEQEHMKISKAAMLVQ